MIKRTGMIDDFVSQGRNGSWPVIDMHGHCGPFRGIYFPNPNPEDMTATLKTCGAEKIVCSHHTALVDPERGNRIMAEIVQNHDRLLGYWVVNPNYPDLIERDLNDFGSKDGFVGFKMLSDYHKYPLSGKAYRPVFACANQNQGMILMHTWGGSSFDGSREVEQVVGKYPNITFLLGHSIYGEWEDAARLASDHENVYLELTAAYAVGGVVEYLVEKAGSEKVIFGTDLPWFDPHYGIGCIIFSRINDRDRKNILYTNARRLLQAQGVVL